MPPMPVGSCACSSRSCGSLALSASSLTVLYVLTAALAARSPAPAAAAWFWMETPLPRIAAMCPSMPMMPAMHRVAAWVHGVAACDAQGCSPDAQGCSLGAQGWSGTPPTVCVADELLGAQRVDLGHDEEQARAEGDGGELDGLALQLGAEAVGVAVDVGLQQRAELERAVHLALELAHL
eukprot:scaffold79681_cov69-Phaeocystis_antarctica.AAC.5